MVSNHIFSLKQGCIGIVKGIGIGFLSCIGIGIGIVKGTFQVLVLVLVLLGASLSIGIGIGIVKSSFQVLVLVLLRGCSQVLVLVLGSNFGIAHLWKPPRLEPGPRLLQRTYHGH